MSGIKKVKTASDILTRTEFSNTETPSFQRELYTYSSGASKVLGIVDWKNNEAIDTLTRFLSTGILSNFDNLLSSNLLGKQTKTSEPEDIELSNLQITGDGIISDKWDKIENIESRIIEVSEEGVILECFVDYENKTFENRSFPKGLIEGIPLKVYYPVLIKIFTRKNELKFLFIDGTGLVDVAKFNVGYFDDISFEMFNHKI